MPPRRINGNFDFEDWNNIELGNNSSLMIGNGSSIAVSQRFAYQVLFERAVSRGFLQERQRQVFDVLDTSNFEEVVRVLDQTQNILQVLDQNADIHIMNETRNAITAALRRIIGNIHPTQAEVGANRLDAMRESLLSYRAVYTTNYDLLAYWSLMRETDAFIDFFFGGEFSRDNVEVHAVNATRTRLLYLHGGLHLIPEANGVVGKLVNGIEGILQQIQNGENIPLFVAEGTAAQKQEAIARSPYLTFANSQLRNQTGQLVIFG